MRDKSTTIGIGCSLLTTIALLIGVADATWVQAVLGVFIAIEAVALALLIRTPRHA
jgi:hypothetical protein